MQSYNFWWWFYNTVTFLTSSYDALQHNHISYIFLWCFTTQSHFLHLLMMIYNTVTFLTKSVSLRSEVSEQSRTSLLETRWDNDGGEKGRRSRVGMKGSGGQTNQKGMLKKVPRQKLTLNLSKNRWHQLSLSRQKHHKSAACQSFTMPKSEMMTEMRWTLLLRRGQFWGHFFSFCWREKQSERTHSCLKKTTTFWSQTNRHWSTVTQHLL